jgi:hypothetical protein
LDTLTLNPATARYIMTRALDTRKTPAEVINGMVSERIAAEA